MAVRDINYFLLYNDGTKVIRHPTGFVMCCTKIGEFSMGPVIQNLYLLFCTSTVLSSFFFGIPVDHKFLNNNNNNNNC